MFAVSIPTNVVIGTRLRRDSRASAMGIAVGILMGSQALGAALGGVAANVVGAPRAIAGSLALAALFGVWALLTSPYEPKHLARSEEHTSELQSLMRISYAVFCLKKKKQQQD